MTSDYVSFKVNFYSITFKYICRPKTTYENELVAVIPVGFKHERAGKCVTYAQLFSRVLQTEYWD